MAVPVEFASALINEKIKELGDWRREILAEVRGINTGGRPFASWRFVATFRRAIDIREDEAVDEALFKHPIRTAVALNLAAPRQASSKQAD